MIATAQLAPPRPHCAHCELPVPAALVRPEATLQFCCAGCRGVYETLNELGLDRYYAIREVDLDGAASAVVEESADPGAAFEDAAFAARHVVELADGEVRVDFLLDGVRCAACLWLVEQLPRVVEGVLEARLNLRDARVRVRLDPARASAADAARGLMRLGYRPHPAERDAGDALRRGEERRRLMGLGVAAVCAGNAMLVAFALYSAPEGTMSAGQTALFRWVGTVLGAISLAWPGREFFTGAAAAVRARRANLDLPIAIALGAGGVAGVVNTLLGRGETYFDSLTVLVFLLLVGRLIQARQQRWASDSIHLARSLFPVTCTVERPAGRAEVPVESLEEGDVVWVAPGGLVPADGVIARGRSELDHGLLTGESRPEPGRPGDRAYAGSRNLFAPLSVRVTGVGDGTRLGRLLELVREGIDSKPALVRLTDRIAGVFVAVVCAAAAATLVGWSLAGPVATAMDHTVALLVVACPCALGLATPLTLALALARAARGGCFVKDAAALERLAGGGDLLLDKTGTLTEGSLCVVDWFGASEWRGPVALLESGSRHPVARALARDLDRFAEVGARVEHDRETVGGGILGRVAGVELAVGTARFLEGLGLDPEAGCLDALRGAKIMEDADRSVVWVGARRPGEALFQVVASAGLADRLRADSRSSVGALARAGWRPHLLSGDGAGPVRATATAVQVPEGRAHARLSPEDKLERVQAFAAKGQATLFVGDGVNDAAALAAADVGIAVHGSAEASMAAADVFVSRDGLGPVVELVQLAKRTLRVVRRSLVLSLAYNAVAVGLAAAGLVDPLLAAILMPISSAIVLGHAALGVRGPLGASEERS